MSQNGQTHFKNLAAFAARVKNLGILCNISIEKRMN